MQPNRQSGMSGPVKLLVAAGMVPALLFICLVGNKILPATAKYDNHTL
jgi:hypothetical protein